MSEEAHSERREEEIQNEEESSFWNIVANKFEAKDWNEIAESIKEMLIEVRKASLAEKKSLSWPVFILIAIIFASVVLLAGMGRIEGHYVTALGSVIIGYMLSFLEISFKSSDA